MSDHQKAVTIISATGSYIPEVVRTNQQFSTHRFYTGSGEPESRASEEIIERFGKITGIYERRYAGRNQVTSDLAYLAAVDALKKSDTDPETLDYLIVAHNFGDMHHEGGRSEMVPSLASRVKHKLGIANPGMICYDLIFGCAGWLQGLIQADSLIRSGLADKVMIIGAEVLSRVIDPHDRDGMLYADGAGCVILERSDEANGGVLSCVSKTYAGEHAWVLKMGPSNNPSHAEEKKYLKMQGRPLYEQALTVVPGVIADALHAAGLEPGDIDKVLIHQANEKMIGAIVKRLFALYGLSDDTIKVMPVTLDWLGNSSVATIPTLLDLMLQHKTAGHHIKPGDQLVLVSVGAGVNVSAVTYKVPLHVPAGNAGVTSKKDQRTLTVER